MQELDDLSCYLLPVTIISKGPWPYPILILQPFRFYQVVLESRLFASFRAYFLSAGVPGSFNFSSAKVILMPRCLPIEQWLFGIFLISLRSAVCLFIY
jgi:hypothetical protein